MRKRSTPLTPNPLRRKPRRRLRLFRNSRVCSADEVRGSRAQVLDPLLLFRAQFQMFLAQFQVSSFPSTVILSEAGRSRFAGSGSGVEGPVQNLFATAARGRSLETPPGGPAEQIVRGCFDSGVRPRST